MERTDSLREVPDGRRVCPKCNGLGEDAETGKKCKPCNGNGDIDDRFCHHLKLKDKCPDCEAEVANCILQVTPDAHGAYCFRWRRRSYCSACIAAKEPA